MTMLTVRRLAADIMNVGKGRVKINPDGLKEAEGALTRSDVKGLIEKGIITKAKIKGRASKAKKQRRGKGSRKGSYSDSKKRWMEKVRAQRKLLALLVESNALKKTDKRSIYGKVKSGIFRNKKAMLLYLKDNHYIPDDYEEKRKNPKKEKPKKAPKKGVNA
ncbi:50S ribosomal protein L19e [Candidatus Micrarchaeota archaeon]|nr:50S ribosomal protein L19e [Candidatus Micrarchaeota archaeon]